MQILIAERFTCCVCREAELPVSIHHIREWNESHDHSPENLCLVCPLHHVKAHTRSTMARNLTEKTMANFKAAWEAEVKTLDLKAVLAASRIQSDAWLYFNHLRLFEIAKARGVKFKQLEYYDGALSSGLIDPSGMLSERDRTWSYMYNDGRGMTLYGYVQSVLYAVIDGLSGVNISDMLEVGLLKSILSAGDFIVLQGLFSYSTNDIGSGRGQTTHGRRSANHVEVEFTFDRWEATSNSAWGRWLRGSQTAAVLIRLVKISADDGRLKLEGTAIAISQQLNGLKTREYASLPYRQGVYLAEDETDEFDL